MNRRTVLRLVLVLCALLLPESAIAQQLHSDQQTMEHEKTPDSMRHPGSQARPAHSKHGTSEAQHGQQEMTGMQHHGMGMQPKSFVENVLHHSSSGTTAELNSTPTRMLMTMKGSWTLMFHGAVWLNEMQQSGPRGFDKFFAANWFMPMAQRSLGPGQLTVRTMLSFEPATVTKRRYPELFQWARPHSEIRS